MRKKPPAMQHQIDTLERMIHQSDPALVVFAKSRLDEKTREMTRPNFPVSPREAGIYYLTILQDLAASLN